MTAAVQHRADWGWSMAAFVVELASVFATAVDYTVRVAAVCAIATYVWGS